jgi:predicted nucleic-acid-binding protein
MIALDTNTLVRMLIEDDKDQFQAVRKVIGWVEKNSRQILLLSEVLMETIWVLESIYRCTREDISIFLERLTITPTFTFADPEVIRRAVHQYKQGGDFADLIIVGKAKENRAKKFFSFDKKLQKKFPDYVVGKIQNSDVL